MHALCKMANDNYGYYGDIDTWCQRPVKEWLPVAKPAELENYEPEKRDSVGGMAFMDLEMSDCSIIIARENTDWFVQWVRVFVIPLALPVAILFCNQVDEYY